MKRGNGEGTWYTQITKGKKYYVFRIPINGKRKTFTGKTKKEAQEKYKAYISTSHIETEKSNDSFYSYCHDWLFKYKKEKVKIRTFDYYDFIIENFIKNTKLGNMKIQQLNDKNNKETVKLFTDHIDSYLDKSKSTLDGLHTVLNQVCKYGVTYQDFVRNFMIGVDKVSEKQVGTKKKEIEALDYNEVMRLWKEMLRKNEEGDVVNGKIGNYVYGIGAYALLFCCFTGLRWGEVSRLEWRDIQKDGDVWYFKVDKQYVTIKNRDENSSEKYITISDKPKSEKSERYIPLCDEAKKILCLVAERFPQYHKDNHLIFSTTNNPYSASTANRLLKAMCIRAKIPVVTPHALRHSFASILLNEDEKNLYAVSDLLGHSSSDVTYKRYIDIFEKNKMNTVNLFSKIKKKGDST